MRRYERPEYKSKKQKSDWKDHPLAVAAISSSTSLIFMATVVVPLANSYYANKVNELEDKLKMFASADKTISALRASEKSLKENLAASENSLYKLLNKNAFEPNNPVPISLDKIKIGDKMDKIKDVYEDITLNENGYVTARIKHPLFNRITFYIDKEKGVDVITHIGYGADPKHWESGLLVEQLRTALGQPIPPPGGEKNKKYNFWQTENYNVFNNSEINFVVMPPHKKLAAWPKDEVKD